MSGFTIKDQMKYYQTPKPCNSHQGQLGHKWAPGRREALNKHTERIRKEIGIE